MQGIANFFSWIATGLTAIVAALIAIGVVYFIGYRIAWTGLKRTAQMAEAQNVSLKEYAPQIGSYLFLILGAVSVAAFAGVVVGNYALVQRFWNGLFIEAITRTSWRGGPILPLGAISLLRKEDAKRCVRRIFGWGSPFRS